LQFQQNALEAKRERDLLLERELKADEKRIAAEEKRMAEKLEREEKRIAAEEKRIAEKLERDEKRIAEAKLADEKRAADLKHERDLQIARENDAKRAFELQMAQLQGQIKINADKNAADSNRLDVRIERALKFVKPIISQMPLQPHLILAWLAHVKKELTRMKVDDDVSPSILLTLCNEHMRNIFRNADDSILLSFSKMEDVVKSEYILTANNMWAEWEAMNRAFSEAPRQ